MPLRHFVGPLKKFSFIGLSLPNSFLLYILSPFLPFDWSVGFVLQSSIPASLAYLPYSYLDSASFSGPTSFPNWYALVPAKRLNGLRPVANVLMKEKKESRARKTTIQTEEEIQIKRKGP